MNAIQAHRLLREVLDDNGLTEVRAELNGRLTSVFGRYRYSVLYGKRVELSTQLVELNDLAKVYNVILHEVAHALTEGHGHDRIWQAKHLELGGDGKRCYSSTDTNTIERKRSSKLYKLVCQGCGYEGGRYRRRMNNYSHTRCGGRLVSVEITQ